MMITFKVMGCSMKHLLFVILTFTAFALFIRGGNESATEQQAKTEKTAKHLQGLALTATENIKYIVYPGIEIPPHQLLFF